MTEKIPQPMRIETCPACAMLFSFPLDFYLARVKDNGAIHCPGGHVMQLTAISPDTRADVVDECRRLRSQLLNIRNGIVEQKAEAEKSPDGLVKKAELKRRCEILSFTSKRGQFGRCICQFCGKGYTAETTLRNHYRRQHPVEVSDLNASSFEPK